MATHDYVIANQSGSAFRADLNDALGAIVTQNSSSTEPGTKYPYQYWVDTSTTPALLKQRNAANGAWITLAEVDGQQLLGNGTTSKPAIAFVSDVNTGLYRAAADEVGIVTGGTERVRVDSSGRLGVGTTDPTKLLEVSDNNPIIRLKDTDTSLGDAQQSSAIEFYQSDSSGAGIGAAIVASAEGTTGELAMTLHSGSNTEAMRIDAQGHVGIGLTNPSSFKTNADDLVVGDLSDSNGHGITIACSATNAGRICFADGTSETDEQRGMLVYNHDSSSDAMTFFVEGTQVASIRGDCLYVMGATSQGGRADTGIVKARGINTKAGLSGALEGNAFNIEWTGSGARLWVDSSNQGTISTSSDYRIKKDIETISTNCIDRIKQLRPVQYQIKDYEIYVADGVTREGFIAHEVAEVIPSGCEGEKDAENQIQSLRLDAILSVTVKALQEAVAKIETLEARVATLEAS